MKINFKLGGTNQGLVDPLGSQSPPRQLQWYGAKAHTMIVGADFTHPGKTRNPTMLLMAGIVATRDASTGHYLGSARLQDQNTEVNSSAQQACMLLTREKL